MRNTKGTCHCVRIKRVSALRDLSEQKRHGHMFIDIKTKADISRSEKAV